MNTLLTLFPLLIVLVAAIALLVSVAGMWIHHLHPLRILSRTVAGGTTIGFIALLQALPATLWWVLWALVVVTVAGAAVAAARLLRQDLPREPAARQTRLLSRPHPVSLIIEALFFLVVLTFALVSG